MSKTASIKETIITYHCTGCGLEHSQKADSTNTVAELKRDGYKAVHGNQGKKSYIKPLLIKTCESCDAHYFN